MSLQKLQCHCYPHNDVRDAISVGIVPLRWFLDKVTLSRTSDMPVVGIEIVPDSLRTEKRRRPMFSLLKRIEKDGFCSIPSLNVWSLFLPRSFYQMRYTSTIKTITQKACAGIKRLFPIDLVLVEFENEIFSAKLIVAFMLDLLPLEA